MKLQDFKVTENEISTHNVKSAADTYSRDNDIKENKNIFDRLPELIATKLNRLIDKLEQEGISKEETAQRIAQAVFDSGAADMQKAVYDSDNDGIVDKAKNGFHWYIHSKSGTVHNLTGTGENLKFVATADWNTGDSLRINGVVAYCFNAVGERLEDEELFKENCTVTCITDGVNTFFKQGGAGLNFKIVGGTAQPASPKENTIWVNTDMSIPKWDISISRPEAGVAGQVWLVAGAESNISFNALKKNGITEKIVAAQQWNGTEWITVEVKGYINGSWKDSDIYIFSATNGINRGTWAKNTDGILTVSEDMVLVSAKNSSYGRAVCSEGVDVTNLNKLIFNVNEFYKNDNDSQYNYVGLYSQADASLSRYTRRLQVTATGEYVIDTSALNGVYYPKIQAHSYYDSDGKKTRVGVNEIKFCY